MVFEGNLESELVGEIKFRQTSCIFD